MVPVDEFSQKTVTPGSGIISPDSFS